MRKVIFMSAMVFFICIFFASSAAFCTSLFMIRNHNAIVALKMSAVSLIASTILGLVSFFFYEQERIKG